MGIPAEPAVILPRGRAGVALPAAIFGIVIVSLLTAGAWSMTELDLKATNNRIEAATALRLAHTAETHAIAVLRNRVPQQTTLHRLLIGFDSVPNSDDDGRLVGYPLRNSPGNTLGDTLSVPATGKTVTVAGKYVGKYFIRIVNDPQDSTPALKFIDTNRRVRIICTGVTASGSSAEINVVVANFSLPALAVDGPLEISSTVATTSTGACGGIHANGPISGGGKTTVQNPAEVTSTGTISHTVVGTQRPNQPVVAIPDLKSSDFCGASGYVHIGSGSTGYSSGTWKPGVLPRTGDPASVVYCVTGNVEFQSDFGTASVPKNVTIIASGSIKVGGKKVFMKAAHPDDIVMMAGGDMDLQGDAGFTGMIYAGAQCYISGKPAITGQLICKNKPWPHPGENWVQLSDGKGLLISGDATFNFTCNSMLTSVFGVVAWYPTVGT